HVLEHVHHLTEGHWRTHQVRPPLRTTLTWYTVPLPAVEPADCEAIATAGHGVLEARALHPERSLAEHYNSLAMDPALVKAHDVLDRLVDRAFGAKKKLTSNDDRGKLLFDQYAAMSA